MLSAYGRTLMTLLITVALGVPLAACGGAASTSTAEQTVTSCLSAADSTRLRTRRRPMDRGFNKDGDLIRVERLDSPAAAKKLVQDATDVAGASGGQFAVFGPQGSQLTVTPIAACLRRVKS